jgi:hypothetical protein
MHRGSGLTRKPFATLGTSSFQHQATTFVGHPRQETVGSLSAQIAWLEGPLHGFPSLSCGHSRDSIGQRPALID